MFIIKLVDDSMDGYEHEEMVTFQKSRFSVEVKYADNCDKMNTFFH